MTRLSPIVLTACGLLLWIGSGAEGQENKPSVPSYQLNRADEDYRYLRLNGNGGCILAREQARRNIRQRGKRCQIWQEQHNARFIGSQPQVSGMGSEPHITLVAIYAHFFAGPFLRETGLAQDVDFATTWVRYQF